MQPVLSASSLSKDNVVNQKGEDVGTLKELMIDTSSGHVEYGVLSFGGVMGVGEKLFAIPFERFSVDTDNHRLVLNVDKEHLKDAPGFDKNDWPNFANPDFQYEIKSFYEPRA